MVFLNVMVLEQYGWVKKETYQNFYKKSEFSEKVKKEY